MKIYFAGSIRGGRKDQKLYLEIIGLLSNYGEVLTEHVSDAGLGAAGELLDEKMISACDLAWLKDADCLVAEVTTPSLGVGFEIGKATEWKKPALCLYRPEKGRSLSAMISGSENIRVCEYQTILELKKIFDSFFSSR